MTHLPQPPERALAPAGDEVRALLEARLAAETEFAASLSHRREVLTECDLMVRRAQAQAQQISDDATQQRAIASNDAQHHAAQLLADARATAESLLAAAEGEAHDLRTEAEASRAAAARLDKQAAATLTEARDRATATASASAVQAAQVRTQTVTKIESGSAAALAQADHVVAGLQTALADASAQLNSIRATQRQESVGGPAHV